MRRRKISKKRIEEIDLEFLFFQLHSTFAFLVLFASEAGYFEALIGKIVFVIYSFIAIPYLLSIRWYYESLVKKS